MCSVPAQIALTEMNVVVEARVCNMSRAMCKASAASLATAQLAYKKALLSHATQCEAAGCSDPEVSEESRCEASETRRRQARAAAIHVASRILSSVA